MDTDERRKRQVRSGSRAVKLLMRICSPDYPRQQTLVWRAESKYHSLRPWNRPQISRVGPSLNPAVRSPDQPLAPAPRRRVGARRLQPAAAAATTRHLFRPSACHLPDYARRRFRSRGWLSHHVDGKSSAPQRVPVWHLASGDPPLGLLSQADLAEWKHAATAASDPGVSGHW